MKLEQQVCSLELAKKLKDAGFTIKKACMCDEEICPHYSFPTLSELIDACGNSFYGLMRSFPFTEWVAGEDWNYDYFGGATGYGSTPEEAVCNLWLELNKK